jgi:hypothetical protein
LPLKVFRVSAECENNPAYWLFFTVLDDLKGYLGDRDVNENSDCVNLHIIKLLSDSELPEAFK